MRPDNDDICQEISLWAVRRGLPDPVNLPRSTRLRQKFAVAAARRQRNHVPIPSGPGSEPPSNAPHPGPRGDRRRAARRDRNCRVVPVDRETPGGGTSVA